MPEGGEPVPIEGQTEPPAEGGAEQRIDFFKEHEVAPVGHKECEQLLIGLVTKKVRFTVTGAVGGGDFNGVFAVDVSTLIWRSHPDPDEDEDKIKDYPYVAGVYDVQKVAQTEEEGSGLNLEYSPLKVSVCIELSDFVMSVEEGEQSNVMSITIQELHSLPKAWNLEEGDAGGDDHIFSYQASYSIPSTHGIVEVTAKPGSMVPATPPPAPPEGAEGEGDEAGESGKPKQAEVPQIAVLQQTLREVDANLEKGVQRVVWAHTYTTFMNSAVSSTFTGALRMGTKFTVDIKRMYKDEDKEYAFAAKYHGKCAMDLSEILQQDRKSITVRSPVGPAIQLVEPTTEDEMPDIPDSEKDQVLHDANITAPYLLYETYLVLGLSTVRPIVKKPPSPPPVLATVADILPKRPPVHAVNPEKGGAGEESYKAELRNIILDMTEAYMKLEAEKRITDSNNPDAVGQAQKEMLAYLKSKSVGKWHDFKVKLKTAVVKVVNERFHKLTFGGVELDPADEIGSLNTFLRTEMNEGLARAFAAKKSFADEPSLSSLKTLLADELRLADEAEMRMDYRTACVHLAKRIIADPTTASHWFNLGCVTCRSGNDAKAEECFHKARAIDPNHVGANLGLGALFCKRNCYREAEPYFECVTQNEPGINDTLAWACATVFYDLDSQENKMKTCAKKLRTMEEKLEKKTGKEAAKEAAATRRSSYLRAGSFFLELHATLLVERAMTQEFKRPPDTSDMTLHEAWSTSPSSTEELKVVLGRAYLNNKQYAKARMHLDDAIARAKDIRMSQRLPETSPSSIALTLKGHTHYIEQGWHQFRCDRELPVAAGFPQPYENSNDRVSIEEFYNKAMASKQPYIDIEQYFRLARLLIGGKVPKFPAAQRMLEKACKMLPSATTWLGLGIANYYDKKYLEAEQSLQEALILDAHNAEVWGMICLVALRQILELPPAKEAPPGVALEDGRTVDMAFPPKLHEASEALRRALAENIGLVESYPRKDTSILEEACDLFADPKIMAYDLAASAVRQALVSVPDCMEARVFVKDIKKPDQKLHKEVDTVVLQQNDEVALGTLLKALQDSHCEASDVVWDITPPKTCERCSSKFFCNQEPMHPETTMRLSKKQAQACERQKKPEYVSALDGYDKAWQAAFLLNNEPEKNDCFEKIKKICELMGEPERKKEYISRMKPPTRKTDTRRTSAH